MIQDIFTSQLVAELLDWRVLFGVLALYRRGHVHHVDGTLRELIYYTKPLAVSARRRVMDGVETTDELLFPQEPVSRAARIRRDNTHPRTHR